MHTSAFVCVHAVFVGVLVFGLWTSHSKAEMLSSLLDLEPLEVVNDYTVPPPEGAGAAQVDPVATGETTPSSACPVCERVLHGVDVERTAYQLSHSSAASASSGASSSRLVFSDALQRFCARHLDIEEQQFCYNVETLRKQLSRLVRMKLPYARVCDKLVQQNEGVCPGGADEAAREATRRKRKGRKPPIE